jgi:hypothetical protein
VKAEKLFIRLEEGLGMMETVYVMSYEHEIKKGNF